MKDESKDYAIKLLKEEILFGFYTKEEMIQSIGDAFYDEDDFDKKWLKNKIKTHLKKYKEESATWKTPTDFDRLVKAFDQLSEEKIVPLHRAGYTKQDAYDECMEVIKKLKKKNIQAKGYCYYHTQDLERVISESKMLFIGFDSFNGEDKLAMEVANTIVEVLKENNFEIKWNASIETRIEIHNINWQKTVDNIDYGYKRIKKIMQNNSNLNSINKCNTN